MAESKVMARRLGALLAGCTLGLALLVGGMPPTSAARAETGSKDSTPDSAAPDQVVLKSGQVIRCRILEETDTTIKVLVVVGSISAPATYKKSDVLEIKRGAAAPASKPVPAAGTQASKSVTTSPVRPAAADDKQHAATIDPTAVQLYIVTLKGRFGFDISETPLTKLFEDADRTFNDLVPGTGADEGRQVVDPGARDRHIVVLKMDTGSQPGFSTIFRTEELAPIVKEQIFDKHRRVVFWIEQAGGGAAFLPWISEEIYFTSEGELGGIADLDTFSSGDKMVDEKLISAFLGHAEGFAIKGGYQDHIPVLRAMIRAQNWLCVRFEGGKPVYLARRPSESDGEAWLILSDEGKKDDSGNSGGGGMGSGGGGGGSGRLPTYTLTAEWADKLGISDGTADTEDDLAFRMGIQRNHTVLKDVRAQKIVDDWKKNVEQAVKMVNPEERPGFPLGTLWREYNELGQPQGDADDVKRALGKRLQLIRQIRNVAAQYAEVFDPSGSWRAELDVEIERRRKDMEDFQRNQRGMPGGQPGRGGGGGGRGPVG